MFTDAEKRDALRSLMLGELSVEDTRIIAMAESDAAFGEELQATRQVLETLERTGGAARQDMAEAHAAATVPGLERAAETLQGLIDRDCLPGPEPLGPIGSNQLKAVLRWVGAAAAGIALIWAASAWLGRSKSDPGRTGEPVILGDGLEALRPAGEVEAFELFAWDYPERKAAWFEVRVYDGRTGERIDVEEDLQQPRWRPGVSRSAPWPAELRWEVVAFDSAGRPLDTASAKAKRR